MSQRSEDDGQTPRPSDSKAIVRSRLSSMVISPTPTPLLERAVPKPSSSKASQEDIQMVDSNSEADDSEASHGSSVLEQRSETPSLFPWELKGKSRQRSRATPTVGRAELDTLMREVRQQKAQLTKTLKEQEELRTSMQKATLDLDTLYGKIQ